LLQAELKLLSFPVIDQREFLRLQEWHWPNYHPPVGSSQGKRKEEKSQKGWTRVEERDNDHLSHKKTSSLGLGLPLSRGISLRKVARNQRGGGKERETSKGRETVKKNPVIAEAICPTGVKVRTEMNQGEAKLSMVRFEDNKRTIPLP